VKWPPTCENVGPGGQKRPQLSQLRASVVRNGWWLKPVEVREPRGRRTSANKSRYQATASEYFMCAVGTLIFGVCNSVILS
jgi:hypothetical protein